MMDKSVTEPSERESHGMEGDPLNLRGSYDAPAFIRLGRRLGSEVPFEPPGVMTGSGMAEHYS
ncbi:MAG: hypothetical protein HW380_2826 [Magnetococcales bacterium]|nr:hypothetical protein [Magnetococcales bacterium]HIJ83715.1 hypothetical protein [Magnetococcales bacterium]